MPLENKYFTKMIGLLPWYERKSSVYQELFKSVSIELQREDLNIEDIKNQLNLDKATWGLVFWEIPYGIVPKNESDYNSRRALIKSKQQGYGKSDAALIKTIVESFVNGEVIVNFNGKILVHFNTKNQGMVNLNLIVEAIDEVKPAHLDLVLFPSIVLEPDKPTDDDIKNGYKGKIFNALNLSYAHTITIYPYAIKDTKVNSNEYIATANASTTKEIIIYNKRSDNN